MSSVDLSSRGFPTASQESSSLDTRYNSPKARPPRLLGSSTGRAKTEQVVLEFLHKAAELIIQSRVNLQTEPDLRRGSRRARFNLDIEEVPMVRDAMTTWKEDVRLPLAIDISWDGAGDGRRKVLLERWSVSFVAEGGTPLGSTQDVIQQLKEVCKRISVLLRALFSFMRQLPAHRLFVQAYPSVLSYTMHAAPASDATQAFEAHNVATSGYAFIPIATPFGLLKVAAVYRLDCDQFTERQELPASSRIFQDSFIIQDYVPGSPKLAPASAPEQSTTMTHSPMREMDLRADSFVPVGDAEQCGGEDARDLHVQRRRSSPRSILMSVGAPQQQIDSTSLADIIRTDDEVTSRPQQSMSKPMAIPRVSSKVGSATTGTRDAGTAIGYREEKSDENVIPHAHSYGGDDDVRLRGAAANPNVTAAPYGYGNVAVEREQPQSFSPSLAFQQRQQQLWEGTNRQETESALRVSQASFHDEPSTSNTSHHPLSTPPRHPKTVSLQQNDSRRRKISFNGAFVSEVAHSQCLTTPAGIVAMAEATTITSGDARTDMAVFSASPPFQANPCELLSTSPCYSYSMSRIQSGSSNAPIFITTNQFHLDLHSVKGSPSTSLISAKKRGFLPDFGDSAVTAWGVSPDTPDSFGLALVGANTSVSGGRPRLSLSGSAEMGSAGTAQGDESFSDGSDLLLPFAIGDSSTSATTALDSQSTSTLNWSSRLETAAVGEFLHQLKNAPRLSRSASAVSALVKDKTSGKPSQRRQPTNCVPDITF